VLKSEIQDMVNKKIKANTNIMKELKNKTILITGGAGSVGSVLVKKILEFPVKTVRVLDVDEHALFRLGRSVNDPRLRLLLGSINDKERIEIAIIDVDIILHLAAIKNIEISEFNPIETIETNVNGMINLLKTSLKNKPKKFLNISTDKAAEASTLYGTTKQICERLTSWAGVHTDQTKFASVRLGNIMETRGNVFEIWEEEMKNKKPLSITDPKMERYFFHVDEAVDFIIKCIPLVNMGEIFIPKMKSYNIKDLASKISNNHKIIGLRQGEKLEEILITEKEKNGAKEKEDMWIVRQYL
jgi:UDP-N-acetylglucosamine 4,6-dehydratase/5-epimerase